MQKVEIRWSHFCHSHTEKKLIRCIGLSTCNESNTPEIYDNPSHYELRYIMRSRFQNDSNPSNDNENPNSPSMAEALNNWWCNLNKFSSSFVSLWGKKWKEGIYQASNQLPCKSCRGCVWRPRGWKCPLSRFSFASKFLCKAWNTLYSRETSCFVTKYDVNLSCDHPTQEEHRSHLLKHMPPFLQSRLHFDLAHAVTSPMRARRILQKRTPNSDSYQATDKYFGT